jgi:HSP20 family protein
MSSLIPYRYRSNDRADNSLSLFHDDFFRPFFFGGDLPAAFRVDVKDEGDNYVMEAELPGVKRENVKIDVDDGVLTISAEWKNVDKENKSGDYIVNERRAGRVQRSFSLDNVVEDKITADYSDGVLRLTMPKREEVRRTPRRIELK